MNTINGIELPPLYKNNFRLKLHPIAPKSFDPKGQYFWISEAEEKKAKKAELFWTVKFLVKATELPEPWSVQQFYAAHDLTKLMKFIKDKFGS